MLGLLAKTREGADLLRDLEWESVRHQGDERWPVVETKVENKEEVIPFTLPTPELNTPYSSFGLGSITESDTRLNTGGIYLGEDVKPSSEPLGYDKISGIYIGDEKPSSRKPSRDDNSEGGILSRWYEEAERRKKIASRESGKYDALSGVYIGDGGPEKTPECESHVDLVPGGILERLYSDMSIKPKKHWRNLSEGYGGSAEFLNTNSLELPPGKRRALSSVDTTLTKTINGGMYSDVKDSRKETGGHSHSHSITSVESLNINNLFNRELDGQKTVEMDAVQLPATSESRNRSGSDGNDLAVPNYHLRSGSNISSVSGESIDFLDPSFASHSRNSSASETGTYSLQESPTFPSLSSEDPSKSMMERYKGFESSWEGSSIGGPSQSASYRSGSGTDRSPSGSLSSHGFERNPNLSASPLQVLSHKTIQIFSSQD